MKTNLRLTIWHDSHRDTYNLYSPTLGDSIGASFDTRADAKDAAEACGATIIDEKDLVTMPKVVVDGRDLTHVAWWLKNCDFDSVRAIFDEILYHEACIRKENAAHNESSMLAACAMSVSAALALENLTKDLNRDIPSHDWTALANWKLDRMLKTGPIDVTCDLGTVHLEK